MRIIDFKIIFGISIILIVAACHNGERISRLDKAKPLSENDADSALALGRTKLHEGDRAGALRIFLEIEEKLKTAGNPYYKGWPYSQIG